MRADRITDVQNPNCFLYTETPIEKILMEAKKSSTRFDDLWTLFKTLQSQLLESAAGTVSGIRECSGELIKFAKEKTSQLF